jgi:hypothetical protein
MCSTAGVLSSLITPRHIHCNDFRILEILSMYNGGFIAHNILRIASQNMGLHRSKEISYLTDCEIVKRFQIYLIQKLMSRAARFSCASNLRSGRFPLFPLDI